MNRQIRDIAIMLLASVLYVGSVFLAVRGKTFRLDSDYDANLPVVAYVVDTIRNEKRFPFWNPYISTGISVLGDPLSAVTYMPYFLPMLIFGVPDGWWVVIGLHAFMAGVFMWMFLVKITSPRLAAIRTDRSSVRSRLPLWGGLLYMSGGAYAARVAAGHIDQAVSYSWYPLLLLFLVGRKQTVGKAVAAGVLLGVAFLTGDWYAVLFMVIFCGVVSVVRALEIRNREIRVRRWIREILVTGVAFASLGSIKLVPFFLDVWPQMSRFSTFDATRGSLHAFLTWIPFVMPWGVAFYDRPIFQRLLGFWYNWYEYYAFIGLPTIFLFWLPRVIRRREVQILLLLLFVGLAYVARGHAYSPWYGLAGLLHGFRTPQRIYEGLTSVVVALVVLCVDYVTRSGFPRRSHGIGLPAAYHPRGALSFLHLALWGGVLVSFLVNGYQMTRAFEYPRSTEEAVVQELRVRDGEEISVATFACCTQTFLVRSGIRVVNYYYGWRPKNSGQFVTPDGTSISLEPLAWEKPTYILARPTIEFGRYGYEAWFQKGEIVVWRHTFLAGPAAVEI